jgi:hypothetical protein
MVEVKLPGEIEDAVTQTCIYLRRRIYRLCKESHARGEPMHSLFALGVATDGQHAVVLRMRSGAPPAGPEHSFALAQPCPVQRSPVLPLLGAWDFCARPPQWYSSPAPEGFLALARLLAAPVGLLAVDTLLTHLDVRVGPPSQAAISAATGASAAAVAAGGGDGAAGLGEARQCARLVLGERLGSGSTSDAYACSFAGESDAAAVTGWARGAVGLCAKVARVSTPQVQGCFAQETRALQLLAAAEACAAPAGVLMVPRLVAACSRQRDPAWPALLLWPAGQSLASWVEMRVREDGSGSSSNSSSSSGVGGGGGGGSDSDPEAAGDAVGAAAAAAAAAAGRARARCATAVVLRILLALEAGFSVGLVHCDVRPSNIVIGPEGGAVLVDWGISRAAGDESRGCGVAAHADERVFRQTSYAARPAQDVYAALLTWVCIARGSECAAPWAAGVAQLPARREWLRARAEWDAPVARVCEALEAVALVRDCKGPRAAAVYEVAREVLEVLQE